MGDNKFNLPPGFRFCPTDEELVVHFLHRKAALLPCHPDVIPDLGLFPFDPWNLDGKAMCEGNKWYFYSRRTKNNKISENGYWESVGIEEPIYNSFQKIVGMKKYSTFNIAGEEIVKTNWILQECRLPDSSTSSRSRRKSSKTDYSKWVICQVYENNSDESGDEEGLSCMDEVFLSLDDLDEINWPNY